MKTIFKILLMMSACLYATVPTEESISKLYIATFDRAPDAKGLSYWINESKLSLEEIAKSFFDQPETKNKYPSDNSNDDFIHEIYKNILDREADEAGHVYWLRQLNEGKIDRSVFILALINGTLGDDKKLLENKNIVGLSFARAGRNNITDAKNILNGVTIDDTSIDEALKKFGIDEDALNPRSLNKESGKERIAKEWYVRIVVEDTTNDMKTAAAQLGQLEADDVVTKHSLKAIAPFRPTFLNVVFDNPAGVDAGSYTSNFHASRSDADTWEFTIKSHDSSADMILGWRGLYVLTSYIDAENRERYTEYRSMTNPLLQYMTLVDVTEGDEIDILANDTVNEYVFNMNGVTERTFRWKVKDSSIAIFPKLTKFNKIIAPKQSLQKIQVKALRKDAKARPDALKKKRVDTLDMMSPPVFEVLVK